MPSGDPIMCSCGTTAGRFGCAVHHPTLKPTAGVNVYMVNCVHGVDLRFAKCLLCQPQAAPRAITREIRLDENGTVDEILIYVDGKCVLHTERLDKHLFYVGVYTDEGDAQGWFRAPSGKRIVNTFRDGGS